MFLTFHSNIAIHLFTEILDKLNSIFNLLKYLYAIVYFEVAAKTSYGTELQ